MKTAPIPDIFAQIAADIASIDPTDVAAIHDFYENTLPKLDADTQNTVLDTLLGSTTNRNTQRIEFILPEFDDSELDLEFKQERMLNDPQFEDTNNYIDQLTGLPNRHQLMSDLEGAIVEANLLNTEFALINIDLDNLKLINDTLGQLIGDKFLHDVAHIITSTLNDNRFVYRLGGDEFVLLFNSLTSRNDLELYVSSLLDKLRVTMRFEKQELKSSASIGISIFPTDGSDASTLLQHADVAMYHAKEKGRDTFKFYSGDSSIKSRTDY